MASDLGNGVPFRSDDGPVTPAITRTRLSNSSVPLPVVRPTPSCCLGCVDVDGEHRVYGVAWDGSRYPLGDCAYPYCDLTSDRMANP